MPMIRSARLTLQRAGRLARTAASGPGAWRGLGLYAVVLGLNFLGVWVSVRLIAWSKAFYDALENLDPGTALGQIAVFFALIALSAGAWLGADWLRKRLLILWRERLTAQALDLWLGGHAYWMLRPGYGACPIENPDQRVAEDCRKFVEGFLEFTLELISQAVALVSLVAVLWSLSTFALEITLLGADLTVPRYMVWLAPLYAALSTLLAHALGLPLKRLYFARERVEADFRHALVQLRETADQIAQAGGETGERRRLDALFGAIRRNWAQLIRAELMQGLFIRPYMQTVLRVPTFFALPAYFAGQVTLGGLMQLASAFSQVTTTLSWFIFSYRDLAGFVAVCERLDGLFGAARCPAPSPGAPRAIRRESTADNTLRLEGLRLYTPAGDALAPVPDAEIPPGARVWIRGASGEGKTTLAAALTGLWPWGEGRIAGPEARIVTLPAGAPVFADSLLAAACYPDPPAAHDPETLRDLLSGLGLGHRLPPAGAADAPTAGLSMGERQRLGLARALLHRPAWLLLDEATSALDPALEAQVLARLDRALPQSTLLIIAHRRPAGLRLDATLTVGAPAPADRSETERKTA